MHGADQSSGQTRRKLMQVKKREFVGEFSKLAVCMGVHNSPEMSATKRERKLQLSSAVILVKPGTYDCWSSVSYWACNMTVTKTCSTKSVNNKIEKKRFRSGIVGL